LIRFAQSATKHGITEEDIGYVIRRCGLYFYVPPPKGSPYRSERLLFLGDNQRGVAIEVLATRTEHGDLFVFHAKKLSKQYRARYEEALPWRI
jgi:hypothetical protein